MNYTPGFYKLSRFEYDRANGLRNSEINWACKSLAHYHWFKNHPPVYDDDETKAKRFGTLVHRAILEPDNYEKSTVVLPANAPERPQERWRNAKEPSPKTIAAFAFWDDFTSACKGKSIISDAEKNKIQQIVEAVYAHELASEILSDCVDRELSVFTRHEKTGIMLKSMIDLLSRDKSQVWDIKTTYNSEPRKYRRHCRDFGYHRQAAVYSDHFPRMEMKTPSFGHIVIQCKEDEPIIVSVRPFEDELIQLGRDEYRAAVHKISNSIKTGKWPGYEEETIGLEDWELRRL